MQVTAWSHRWYPCCMLLNRLFWDVRQCIGQPQAWGSPIYVCTGQAVFVRNQVRRASLQTLPGLRTASIHRQGEYTNKLQQYMSSLWCCARCKSTSFGLQGRWRDQGSWGDAHLIRKRRAFACFTPRLCSHTTMSSRLCFRDLGCSLAGAVLYARQAVEFEPVISARSNTVPSHTEPRLRLRLHATHGFTTIDIC